MINSIINFLKNLFIKDTKFRVVDDAGVDIETGKYVGDSGIPKEKEEMSKFDEIIEVVLEHEGGYVNDPKDPGGETKYGISKKAYPDIDIKNLTVVDAKEIYKRDYWDKNKVDSVPDELKHIYFDCCVNMGRSRAVKILQQSAVNKGKNIKVDGGMGPNTIKALKGVELERVRAFRVRYYVELVNRKPDLERFYFGWFRRSLEV